MEEQGKQLLELGCSAVLIKGGHGAGADAVDILVTAQRAEHYSQRRLATRNTHGTGCTLAAAVTAGLANGLTLQAAVQQGKDFVWRALQSGADYKIGGGHGPVDHLFNVRKHRSLC
jgi:hydroxymethylpyrimidine/phosphomethylpyrimidine kinase